MIIVKIIILSCILLLFIIVMLYTFIKMYIYNTAHIEKVTRHDWSICYYVYKDWYLYWKYDKLEEAKNGLEEVKNSKIVK